MSIYELLTLLQETHILAHHLWNESHIQSSFPVFTRSGKWWKVVNVEIYWVLD